MSDPHGEYFSLLYACLVQPPTEDLLKQLKEITKLPPATPSHPMIAEGWLTLGMFFQKYQTSKAVEIAQNSHYTLLGNPLGPQLEPYASFYLEGSRQGMPLVAIRQFLTKWGLIPEQKKFKDFEDHVIFMLDCLVQLGKLVETEAEGDKWEEAIEELLQFHIIPWLPNFLADLEQADKEKEDGGFYCGLAQISQGIFAIEKQALEE